MIRSTLQRGLACLLLLFAASAGAAPPPRHKVPTAAPHTVDQSAQKPVPFLEMAVAGVVPTPDGTMVVLINAEEELLLPLGIGISEAISIHGRLEHHQFTRPQTHDLLEHVLKELGGEVVKVQIDDLRDEVFLGSVFIKAGGRVISLDARPSDAIALALGNQVPILVSRGVLDRAALTADELMEAEPEASPEVSAPGEAPGVYTL